VTRLESRLATAAAVVAREGGLMLEHAHSPGRPSVEVVLDPDEFIRAAMDWHFTPATGSPFWLERASSLEFDPRADVKRFEDLALFPNVANELRDVRVEDLIPKGYGPHPEVVGVFESGGTTGAPKRIVMLREWWDQTLARSVEELELWGVPRDRDWLALLPSGPHMAGELIRAQAAALGGIRFAIDMDPRWVKRVIAAGKADEADAYVEHLIDQAAFALETQDVGVLVSTPPLLERLSRRDDLVALVRQKVAVILWAGAHMDADTRHLYRTEVFPNALLLGYYGSTMVIGGAHERPGLSDDDPCVFDPFSPYVTFSVVDPQTARPVPYGERGQVIMNHVSRSFLLPNNLERDMATRIAPREDQVGDSVADVSPVQRFDDEAVIEGVY
jgi:phenylacetate-coenzyme A ligase PaaK-like adenylate-forming protein